MKKVFSLLMIMVVFMAFSLTACKTEPQASDAVIDTTEVIIDTTAVVVE